MENIILRCNNGVGNPGNCNDKYGTLFNQIGPNSGQFR